MPHNIYNSLGKFPGVTIVKINFSLNSEAFLTAVLRSKIVCFLLDDLRLMRNKFVAFQFSDLTEAGDQLLLSRPKAPSLCFLLCFIFTYQNCLMCMMALDLLHYILLFVHCSY